MSEDLTLTQAWEKIVALGENKPAWHIAQANKRGYSDFPGPDGWYRIAPVRSQGPARYTIRKI